MLRVQLQNDRETDIKLYRDVRPRIKGALAITLSTRVLAGLYCDGKDVIKAGGSLDCVKSGVMFIRTRQKVGINENATTDAKVKDLLVAYEPGYFEKVEFDCSPGLKVVPKIQTNASVNRTYVAVNDTNHS